VTAGSAGPDGAAAPALAICCRSLTKRFGSVLALDGLDLDVPAGSVFGFLGPNGAGKTTTLRLLSGLARPTSGSATVAGVPVGEGNAAVARSTGYLDQDPRFHGWMTGREVLEFVGRLYGLTGPDLRSRVAEALATAGLEDAAARHVGGYSGGMRQRLGLAQAVLARPQVLFLDEPVSSLDPEGRRDVLEIIAGLRGTTTVFMSTHILNDVERVCDRVGILDRGRLVTEAPIEDLLERYARPVYRLDPEPGQGEAVEGLVRTLREQAWVRDALVEHGYLRVLVDDPEEAGPALLPLLAGSGVRFAGYERVRPSLEDVFLRLVGEGASGEGAVGEGAVA
jgi:ABC-2 type transport system ATP-binding protein